MQTDLELSDLATLGKIIGAIHFQVNNMVDVLLDRKIRQMHAALDDLATEDLTDIKPTVIRGTNFHYLKVDFRDCGDESKLANVAELVVNNIAVMKDHLKVWCSTKGKLFKGDDLINSNRSVALIHDLWNINKHGRLTSPGRSGHIPHLEGLQKVVNLSSGTTAGSGSCMTIDPITGKVSTTTFGDGAVELSLSASVVDENGVFLGDFVDICSKAVCAWELELKSAGITLPVL